MEKHISVVAALQIGLNILGLMIGLFLFLIMMFAGFYFGDDEAVFIISVVAVLLMGLFIITSVPGIIGGIGLLKRKKWSRILLLIVSALDLISIPIGTALGIYTFWVLLQDETLKILECNNSEMSHGQTQTS